MWPSLFGLGNRAPSPDPSPLQSPLWSSSGVVLPKDKMPNGPRAPAPGAMLSFLVHILHTPEPECQENSLEVTSKACNTFSSIFLRGHAAPGSYHCLWGVDGSWTCGLGTHLHTQGRRGAG